MEDIYFQSMIDHNASDLHIVSGKSPALRIDGDIQILDTPPLPNELVEKTLLNLIPEHLKDEFKKCGDVDFSIAYQNIARLRVNVYKKIGGYGASFRIIPDEVLTPNEIGLPPAVLEMVSAKGGLFLVTGATGSGKCTTLASIVNHLNEQRNAHIITIEDPIEFLHKDKNSIVSQREVGIDSESFPRAMRAVLREDPNIVLLGEMRDMETARSAIVAAETGVLVLATLHTRTAESTVDRLIGQFPTNEQEQIRMMVSGSLLGVVSQTLVKKKSGGRVAAFEVLRTNTAVQSNIREKKIYQIKSTIQTGHNVGMMSMTDSLVNLVKKGIVTPEEAKISAPDKEALQRALIM